MIFKGINYKYKYKVKNVYSGQYASLYSNIYYKQFELIDNEWELLECHADVYNDGGFLIPHYTY